MASDLASRIKAKLNKRRHSVGATFTRSSSSTSRLADQDTASSRSSMSGQKSSHSDEREAASTHAAAVHEALPSDSSRADSKHTQGCSSSSRGTSEAGAAGNNTILKTDVVGLHTTNKHHPKHQLIPSVVLAAPPNEPLKTPRPKSMSAAPSSQPGPHLFKPSTDDGNDPWSLDTTTTTTTTTTTPGNTGTTVHTAAPTAALSYHSPPLTGLAHPSLAPTLQSIHEHAALSPSPNSPADKAADDRDLHHESCQPRADADQLSLVSSSAVAAAAASASNANSPATTTIYTPPSSSGASRPPAPPRRKSLGSSRPPASVSSKPLRNPSMRDEPSLAIAAPSSAMPATRKIWVKRPGASPTLIAIHEDDLVDDVRDTILRKYANSLGKTFDAPDLNIRLHPRDQKDRLLQPDEHMCRTLDAHFPGGQTVDDAIIIDIPRRTPKASPRVSIPHTTAAIYYTDENGRPAEQAEGYFPPVGGLPSPHHMSLQMPNSTNGSVPHSIAVIGTGQLPAIPSPGGTRPRLHRDRSDRPRLNRTQTSSSTMLGHGPGSSNVNAHGMQHLRSRPSHSRTHSSSSDPVGMPPHIVHPAAMPTSPGAEHGHVHSQIARVATPPPRSNTPRSTSARPKKNRKNPDFGGSTGGPNNGIVAGVPPISVLIVEDNPINLKLLEAFVKRLKVRWQTAMNGRDALKKWRAGGFHLVLMDIQLPGMNGLEATREIRRLERVNSIGVFSSVPSTPQEELTMELLDKDRLEHLELFKGPVIIVALTASSLQSDRHEALAAGCNDFLTKPVNFVWLERKVMEWGCMQALIDFDGWRTWKDFAEQEQETSKSGAGKTKVKKPRSSLSAAA